MQPPDLVFEQRLGNGALRNARHQGLGHLLHGPRRDATVFHGLGGDVIGLHPHCRELEVGGLLHVGVGKLVPPVVGLRLAEDNVFYPGLIVVVNPIFAPEPYEVNHVAPIREMRHYAFLAALAELLKALYRAFYLHQWHVTAKLADGVDP